MKCFFLGVCALVLLVGIRAFNDLDEKKAIVECEPNLPAITEGGDEELRTENLRLREQIAQLNKQLMQVKQAIDIKNPSQQGEVSSIAPDETLDSENAHAKIQEFNDLLFSDDSIAELKTNFANEPMDSAWADIHQRELEAFFKKSLPDVYPQYIECRSKRCKLTIAVADQEKFSELSQELTQSVLGNKDGIPKKIVIVPSEDDGTLNFYLARDDHVSFLQ